MLCSCDPRSCSCSALSYKDFIITAGRDGYIKLWSPSIAQVLGELAGHSREVVGMAVHPTKPLLLSASEDGSIRVWGLDTLMELCQLLVPEESLSSFALIDPSHAICYSQKGVAMLNVCMVSKSCPQSMCIHTFCNLGLVSSFISYTVDQCQIQTLLPSLAHVSLQPDCHLTALNSKVTSVQLSGSPGRLVAMCEVRTYVIYICTSKTLITALYSSIVHMYPSLYSITYVCT